MYAYLEGKGRHFAAMLPATHTIRGRFGSLLYLMQLVLPVTKTRESLECAIVFKLKQLLMLCNTYLSFLGDFSIFIFPHSVLKQTESIHSMESSIAACTAQFIGNQALFFFFTFLFVIL